MSVNLIHASVVAHLSFFFYLNSLVICLVRLGLSKHVMKSHSFPSLDRIKAIVSQVGSVNPEERKTTGFKLH